MGSKSKLRLPERRKVVPLLLRREEPASMLARRRGMIDTTISLVSVNQKHDLERLLPSLTEAAGRTPSEILLVDNRSSDGSAEYVRSIHSEIRVSKNSKLSGYGENHSLNLQRAQGRYFLIMNSDMTVDPKIILCLADFMNECNDIGIVSPKILNEDGITGYLF